MASRTVRDATFGVLREHGLTTIFSNPGSTEVSLLTDLPGDLRFVLGLHEASVVGMATGWAIARGEPALAVLHTTAGLGNAVGALATARANRAAIVVLVGQQDRRHLATEPFLAGKLHGLAGEYPVWVDQPVRAADVPGAVARACHESVTGRGPSLVIVPMDDWSEETAPSEQRAAPHRVVRADLADGLAVAELADLLATAKKPALVVGAGSDCSESWAALVALAEHLVCPVWQEPFSGRAGFPQDHRLFAGHLPANRAGLRQALEPHDVVLAVGAPAFRQYPYSAGPFVVAGTRVAVLSDDPAEVHRSAADLAVLARPSPVCLELARLVPPRRATVPGPFAPPAPLKAPAADDPLRAGHVFAAIAERIPADAVVIEEAPSNRSELLARLPARHPLGSLSPAMGGLGFALPAATGMRMADAGRPVVAIVGDGSSLYAIQALWSAAHYEVGVLFVVLANGGYAIMDRLAEQHSGAPPWPDFAVDVAGLARAFGCPAQTVGDHASLLEVLDEVLPSLSGRSEPLLLEVAVMPDETFAP